MVSVQNPGAVRWNAAPKKAGGQNPFLGVLDGLVKNLEAGLIDLPTQKRLIAQAAYYSKRNKLNVTVSTIQGVVKMAAHADKMHRMHMAAMAQRERDEFSPNLRGYDRATGFER